MRVLRSLAALALLTSVSVSPACAQDPLSVAAAGVTTSIVLDKLDNRNNIVQNAGAVGSLLVSKSARDVQLEIMAARIQMHDELNQNWDRLDQQRVAVLRELDSSLNEISKNIGKVSQMQATLFLMLIVH